jgi:insulysin
MNSNQFELIKDEMKNQIKSQMNLVPILRGYVNFFKIVLRDFVEYENIIKTLNNLTLKDFMGFINTLFSKVNLKIFIHGSMAKKEAKILSSEINYLYKSSKAITPIAEKYMNEHANLSGYFIFREHLKNSYNINHAVLNFYQIGQETIPNIIKANLVKALCGYIYFTELRIKEQLGYTTKGKVFSEGNIIYYMILIQGSTKTPDLMDLRIENLLIKMRNRIANTDQKKFERMKFSVARKLGARDRNIKHRTFRLWNEIILKRYYFNMKKLARRYVRKITINDVLDFFDKMVKKDLKKLSVQEFSNLVKKLPKNKPIVNKYKAFLMTRTDKLRKRKNFIKFNYDKK